MIAKTNCTESDKDTPTINVLSNPNTEYLLITLDVKKNNGTNKMDSLTSKSNKPSETLSVYSIPKSVTK